MGPAQRVPITDPGSKAWSPSTDGPVETAPLLLAGLGPEELAAYTALLHSPEGEPLVGMILCYSGPPEAGEKVIEPARKFGSPVADEVAVIPHVQMQTLLDPAFPWGTQNYWKSSFLEVLEDNRLVGGLQPLRSCDEVQMRCGSRGRCGHL